MHNGRTIKQAHVLCKIFAHTTTKTGNQEKPMMRWINRWMISAVLTLFAWMPAQAVELQWIDHNGVPHNMTEYKGKAVLVHFWASWCGPCRHEMPLLTTWLQQHPEVTIIPVSLDDSMEDAQNFLTSNHFNLPAQLTDSSQAMALGARGLPTTLVVNADGDIAARQIGALPWNKKKFSDTVLGFLNQKQDQQP
jgi:thiol-disulfide isomerase/thioredoxin